jgi:hypothetical protein
MQKRRGRRGFTIGLLSLGLLVGVALAASPAQAETTAPGFYYAMPAWDQKLDAATRFIVLSDWDSAAVLDRETGLVWEISPQKTGESWNQARLTCLNKLVGDQAGWRLPSIPELTSLIDPSKVDPPTPFLPKDHPFLNVNVNVKVLDYFWSATTSAEDSTEAWHTQLAHVGVFHDKKDNSHTNLNGIGIRVWCVRGGMNAERY